MASNLYSDIAAIAGTIYEDALFAARDNNYMLRLVTQPPGMLGMAPRNISQYNQGTAKSIGEDDDLTGDVFKPTSLATLTPGEIGLQFFMTDARIDSDPFGARTAAAMELGLTIGKKIETDLIGDFTSLTAGTVGTASAALTWGHFYSALSILRYANAPLPYACVLHPLNSAAFSRN